MSLTDLGIMHLMLVSYTRKHGRNSIIMYTRQSFVHGMIHHRRL